MLLSLIATLKQKTDWNARLVYMSEGRVQKENEKKFKKAVKELYSELKNRAKEGQTRYMITYRDDRFGKGNEERLIELLRSKGLRANSTSRSVNEFVKETITICVSWSKKETL